MVTKEELIKELNGDIAYEFSAAIQYVQHAATLTGGEFQSINAELLVHVNEEIGHANVLSEQVAYLGGVPTMEVAERHTDSDSRKMLEQDLEGERIAIKRYRERIEQAQELKLYGLENALKQILADEEEHERDIMEALGM
ncbi:MAG: ferritin-like domain-containing protein [Kiritimatiellales bacterium]|nr:ferritin-like domain-containing protein [Kiritimatiellales bacterium]